MAMNKAAGGGDHLPYLPPGFRFHPTDEEIITHYLTKKVIDSGFTAAAIGEADLNKSEPWDLPNIAKMGEKEWYFFVQKDRKYPTGTRTNRATVSGYWKATGKDREIYRGKKCLVGMKKTLVFYLGRAPSGIKTNWVMHEFRLEGKLPLYDIHQVAKDEWAVCRVFHKSSEIRNPNPVPDMPRMNNTEQEISANSLPPLIDPSYSAGPGSSFTDGESEFKAGIDHMVSSTLNNTAFPNPNNIPTGINYLTAGSYPINPSPSLNLNPNPNLAQPVFNPIVQDNTSVIRAYGPENPSYYYNQPGNINIGQCKVEPYQSMPMISGPEQYTGFSTNLNPEGSFKPEPLSGSSSMPEFEDLISQFLNNTDSDTGFSWDF